MFGRRRKLYNTHLSCQPPYDGNPLTDLTDNQSILRACASLLQGSSLNQQERALLSDVLPLEEKRLKPVTESIRAGQDPLGEAFILANRPRERRATGEVYTPCELVESMVAEAAAIGNPTRVVDTGCGSGRFSIACAAAFPSAAIVAIDSSPFATLICKANLHVLGLEERVQVLTENFLTATLPQKGSEGRTLWIGNPPYVRHHLLSKESKAWYVKTARELELPASGLAGLHAHFLLSIGARAQDHDFGVFVTSAEWLDVDYGKTIRKLLTDRLGLRSIALKDRSRQTFQGTDTTSVVASFDIEQMSRGTAMSVSVESPQGTRRSVPMKKFRPDERWSPLLENRPTKNVPTGYVQLGDIARVHRGIVTGANKFWVRSSSDKTCSEFSIPVVSHAREIVTEKSELQASNLNRLIALPQNFDSLDNRSVIDVERFLSEGRKLGIDKGYVARSRKCWWSIPIGEGASILMTYMARRPPVFVANPRKIRSLNVVHGIYPSESLSEHALRELVDYLNSSVALEDGRVYCGGLTKFEPREAERLWIPSPTMLEEGSWRS